MLNHPVLSIELLQEKDIIKLDISNFINSKYELINNKTTKKISDAYILNPSYNNSI